MGLNDEQKIVVGAGIGASTNVTAGAGTGKTRVLVERYMRFVRDDGLPPSRILALTFTLKAADEMRRRIYETVSGEDPRLLRQLDEAWIMNFHAFGYRLIRENAPAAEVDPGSDVATPTDIDRVERALRSRFLAGGIEGVDPGFGGDVPSPTQLNKRFDVALKVVRKCRDEGLDPSRLRDMYLDTDKPGYKALVDAVIAVGDEYKRELRRRRLIDFSDMITVPARLLGLKPEIARRYTNRFDHILVDEFQDTSSAQYELLRVLAGDDFAKVTVVGDEKQAIYRWRDARVDNIRNFPGPKRPLSLNYRSRQGILDLAHALICKDPLYAQLTEKIRLEAFRSDENHEIVVFHPEGDGESARRFDAEAGALAGWVRHLTEGIPVEGIPALVTGEEDAPLLRHEEVAVLLRSLKPSSGLVEIEAEFERNGIPYTVVGGANAAESRALKSYHALLSLLLPGNRQKELLYVLENEPYNLDDKSLRELFAGSNEGDALDTRRVLINARGSITNADAAGRCEELLALMGELRSSWTSADFRSFLLFSLEKSSFYDITFAGGGTARSADDVTGELFNVAGELEKRNDLNLGSFLLHLGTVLKANSFGLDKDMGLPPGKVRIMTIHQAKGLEFPAVAVTGIKNGQGSRDGFFLSKKTVLYSN
jgi:DNA helicase-2/ATP-dependent DNA helicase PcrA